MVKRPPLDSIWPTASTKASVTMAERADEKPNKMIAARSAILRQECNS